MEKMKITICAGTTCHVMGGGHLYDLAERLPEDLRGLIEVEGQRCLGYCSEEGHGKPPYVLVNGELVADASYSTILQKIRAIAARGDDK